MSYTYWLHSLAVEDLKNAYSWYENKQAGLGERVLKAIRSKIADIAEHPETYSSKGRKTYREAKVDFFPYVVVYKILKRKKQIYISAIHNTRMNPQKKYRK